MQDATKTCVGCKNSDHIPFPLHYCLQHLKLYVAVEIKIFVAQNHNLPCLWRENSFSVYWLDDYSDNWVTSSFVALPLWLQSFNAKRFAELYVDRLEYYYLLLYTESLGDTCNFEIGIQKSNYISVYYYEIATILVHIKS